ncbi:hypothetical protein SAMN02949497_0382 [Methylomagnum ishizawai]|uniref:Uncharacterized protein n=1 Tax=Methylomagnum ishizawai TaxID=1760988 RepID=A0A1Y6D326_9GAMM|nr:hypothetical protein [Methylomagnum ishizawai]SMF97358.1 hypothetical protein SAMN02949497_0382 [Methylomagnum ishizawai]
MTLFENWSVVSLDNEATDTDQDARVFQAPDAKGDLYLLGMAVGPRHDCTVKILAMGDARGVDGAMIQVSGQEYQISEPKGVYEAAFPNARARLLENLHHRKSPAGSLRVSEQRAAAFSLGGMLKGCLAIYATSVILIGAQIKILEWSGCLEYRNDGWNAHYSFHFIQPPLQGNTLVPHLMPRKRGFLLERHQQAGIP